MENSVSVGDLVVSLSGRDKDKTFLVVDVQEYYAYIVDGKERKIAKPKKKKIKHLKKVLSLASVELADKIRRGEPVSNERLYKTVKAQKEKIQED